MKRRRHVLVEVSSDEETTPSDDDFVPTKLKSKRVSIVLGRKQRINPNGVGKSDSAGKPEGDGGLKICNTALGKRSRKNPPGNHVIQIKLESGQENGEAGLQSRATSVPRDGEPDFSDLDDSLLLVKSATTNRSDDVSGPIHESTKLLEGSSGLNEMNLSLSPIKLEKQGHSQETNKKIFRKFTKTNIVKTRSKTNNELNIEGDTNDGSGKSSLKVGTTKSVNALTTVAHDFHNPALDTQASSSDTPPLSKQLLPIRNTSVLAPTDFSQRQAPTSSTAHTLIAAQIKTSKIASSKKKLISSAPKSTDRDETLGYSFCQICNKNITSYSFERRNRHVNSCCDALEEGAQSETAIPSGDKETTPSSPRIKQPVEEEAGKVCPLCGKTYSCIRSTKRHLFKCSVKHGKTLQEAIAELNLSLGKGLTTKRATTDGETKKKKAGKNKSTPELVVRKDGALNQAQNRILNAVSKQETDDIPATPALKTSNLTTYRSKRNSIWNLAGNSSVTGHPTALAHNNSLIGTQKPHPPSQEDLSSSTQETSICIERSALPSQADITQLTQFLANLSRDNSIKERLSTLIVSPTKVKSEKTDLSDELDHQDNPNSDTGADHGQESMEENKSSTLVHDQDKASRMGVDSHMDNDSHSNRSSRKSSDTMPVSELTAEPEVETTEIASFKSGDRSPNPSEISALGNSSVAVPSAVIRGGAVDSPLATSHIQSPSIDDSNMDLFTDEPGTRTGEFDRSLLNVSPITDHGLPEEEERRAFQEAASAGTPELVTGSRLSKSGNVSVDATIQRAEPRHSSPIYLPKLCSSTTRDVEVSANVSSINKSVQASVESRTKYSEAMASTRYVATNTDILENVTRDSQTDVTHSQSRGCNTDPVSTSCSTSQACGERSLINMMHRLKDHTSSCNVTVLCNDGEQRTTHRVILELSSPQLIDSLVEISSEKTLEIGLTGRATDLFLEYLYTHAIECECISSEILGELQRAAERFKIPELTRHLHTKGTETVEIRLEQESGGTLLLNLSSQDVLCLSEQLMSASQHLSSSLPPPSTLVRPGDKESRPTLNGGEEVAVHHDTTRSYSPDFPSFQEHSFANNWSMTEECGGVNTPAASTRSPSPLTGGVNRSPVDVLTPQDAGCTTETCDDFLPPSGLLAEPQCTGANENDDPDADRRASQLIEDVEFLDLVNSLDDIVVSTPLSLLDRLDTIHTAQTVNTTPTSSRQYNPVNISNFTFLSESHTPDRQGAISVHGVNALTTPLTDSGTPDNRLNNAEISVYQKTPGFKEMETPRLNSEINKYGMKPLTKKKAIAKLEEIHRFTNKKFLKCPGEGTPNDVITTDKTKKTRRGAAVKKRKIDSDDDDKDVSSETECPVGDISIRGKVQKSALAEVSRMVREVIVLSQELHCKILQYEPIDIIQIKGLLKRRTSVPLIAQVLDDQGITYFNSETKAKGFGKKRNCGKKVKRN